MYICLFMSPVKYDFVLRSVSASPPLSPITRSVDYKYMYMYICIICLFMSPVEYYFVLRSVSASPPLSPTMRSIDYNYIYIYIYICIPTHIHVSMYVCMHVLFIYCAACLRADHPLPLRGGLTIIISISISLYVYPHTHTHSCMYVGM